MFDFSTGINKNVINEEHYKLVQKGSKNAIHKVHKWG